MNNSLTVLSGLPKEVIPNILIRPFSEAGFATLSASVWPDRYRFWISITNEYYCNLWHRRSSWLTGVEVEELGRSTVLVSSASHSRLLEYMRDGLELFVRGRALKLPAHLQLAFSDWSFGNLSLPQQTFNIRIVPAPAAIRPFSPESVIYHEDCVDYFFNKRKLLPFGTDLKFSLADSGQSLKQLVCLNPMNNIVETCVRFMRPDKVDQYVNVTSRLYGLVGNEVVAENHASLFVLAKRQNDISGVLESVVIGLCAAALVCCAASVYEVCRLRPSALNREAVLFLTTSFFCFALAAAVYLVNNQDHAGYTPLELSA